jgi:outer membrane protein
MTLADALAQSYQTNPELQAARAALRSADEGISQALSHWRPTIKLNAGQSESREYVSGGTPSQNLFYSGQSPTSSYSVSLNQALFRGGRTLDETRQAMASIRAERNRLISTEQNVFVKVVTDYCDVVRDNSALEFNLHDEQFLAKKVQSTRAQLVGGELSKTDLSQAEAALEQARAARFLAQSTAERSRANFRRDVGIEPGILEYPPVTEWYPKTQEEVTNIALAENPDVLAATFEVRAAEEAVNDAIHQALPQINLSASAQRIEGAAFFNSHENILSVGVQLSVPIYSGGTLESAARAAQQTAAKVRHQLDAKRAEILASTQIALAQAQAQKLSMSAYLSQIKSNEIALEGVQHQQASGERTILDVLNAEQALLQSRLNLNSSHHDGVVASFRLAQALGRATARRLKIAVKYYDPQVNFEDARDRWFGFGINEQ